MRPDCQTGDSARAGFTLIEVLLAVAIAAVVAALAWSLLSSTTRAVERETLQARGPAAAAQAVEQMREDLTRLFLPAGDSACALGLRANGSEPFRLEFCAMDAVGQTSELVWAESRRIEYVVVPTDGGVEALLRITERMAGDVGRETNVVLRPCAAARVELSNGSEWFAQWPAPEGESIPRLARISLQAHREEPAAAAEFWLPVGHSITSRLLRAGSAESAK